MPIAAPQSAQNVLPGGFSAPHALQRTGRAVPQSPQNFFPSRLAAPQLGHSMPHPIDWMRAAVAGLIRGSELGASAYLPGLGAVGPPSLGAAAGPTEWSGGAGTHPAASSLAPTRVAGQEASDVEPEDVEL